MTSIYHETIKSITHQISMQSPGRGCTGGEEYEDKDK